MSQDALFDAGANERAAAEVDALRRLRNGEKVTPREQTLMVAHGVAYLHAADGSLRLTPVGRDRLEAAEEPRS